VFTIPQKASETANVKTSCCPPQNRRALGQSASVSCMIRILVTIAGPYEFSAAIYQSAALLFTRGSPFHNVSSHSQTNTLSLFHIRNFTFDLNQQIIHILLHKHLHANRPSQTLYLSSASTSHLQALFKMANTSVISAANVAYNIQHSSIHLHVASSLHSRHESRRVLHTTSKQVHHLQATLEVSSPPGPRILPTSHSTTLIHTPSSLLVLAIRQVHSSSNQFVLSPKKHDK
jgi:hypothetical protein